MTVCETCRYSNELFKESIGKCGECLSMSSDYELFPLYIKSLYFKEIVVE